MEIKFTTPGPPKGKQRPRICKLNGRSIAYTPKQTIEYEKLIRTRCVAALAKSRPNQSTTDKSRSTRKGLTARKEFTARNQYTCPLFCSEIRQQ